MKRCAYWKLEKLLDKYNRIYYRKIRMKDFDNMSNTYIDFGSANKAKDPKYKVGHDIRISISKYIIIFSKGQTKLFLSTA